MACILRYDGVALQYWWVTDPSRAQNPRRAAYEAVDPNLEVIRDYLAGTGQRPQHDFETGVARLLWLLGFAPAHLGGGHLQSADIVATTPRGDIVVTECTTGLLKGDKRSQLIERTDAIRKRIDGSHVSILPMMVTSKTRAQVRADLEEAEKLGLLVITGEQLQEALEFRTLMMPDANAVFEDALKAVREAQTEHKPQTELDV